MATRIQDENGNDIPIVSFDSIPKEYQSLVKETIKNNPGKNKLHLDVFQVNGKTYKSFEEIPESDRKLYLESRLKSYNNPTGDNKPYVYVVPAMRTGFEVTSLIFFIVNIVFSLFIQHALGFIGIIFQLHLNNVFLFVIGLINGAISDLFSRKYLKNKYQNVTLDSSVNLITKFEQVIVGGITSFLINLIIFSLYLVYKFLIIGMF